jgi:hypothetical protein
MTTALGSRRRAPSHIRFFLFLYSLSLRERVGVRGFVPSYQGDHDENPYRRRL